MSLSFSGTARLLSVEQVASHLVQGSQRVTPVERGGVVVEEALGRIACRAGVEEVASQFLSRTRARAVANLVTSQLSGAEDRPARMKGTCRVRGTTRAVANQIAKPIVERGISDQRVFPTAVVIVVGYASRPAIERDPQIDEMFEAVFGLAVERVNQPSINELPSECRRPKRPKSMRRPAAARAEMAHVTVQK